VSAAPIAIRPASPLSDEARALIAARDACYRALYPPEESFATSAEDLAEAGAHFLLGWQDAAAVGCAALVEHPGYGELKSLYVRRRARGLGLGRRLLAAVEAAARARGLDLMRLETGSLSPEALALYARAGYDQRGPFGAYRETRTSVFMEKRLGGARRAPPRLVNDP